MHTDGNFSVVTLPYSEKELDKLRIKKRRILDNKLVHFSEGVYFTDIRTEGLSEFSKRLKKPDGLITFRRLIPEIAVKTVKRRGIDVQKARVAVIIKEGDSKLVENLSERFRFITAIGNDDALWDNIYEETGLSIPFLNETAAKNADVVIYTGKKNRYVYTNGVSIGFDAKGNGAIGATSLSFHTGQAYSELEKVLKRPITIGEIEAIGCPYKYHLM